MKGMSASLRIVLLIFLVIGAIGTSAADAGLIDYGSLAYIAADNLVLLCALISVILGLRIRDDVEMRRSVPLAALVSTILSVFLSAWLLSVRTPLTLYRWLLIVFIAAALGVCVYAVFRKPEIRASHTVRQNTPLIFAVLIACILLTAMLRLSAPGSAFLTWVMAPLLLLFIPGFSLTLGLLVADAGWMQHIVYAIPLSLGVYLISLAWLVQFSVKVTPPVFFVIALVTTAVGFSIDWFRRQSTSNQS